MRAKIEYLRFANEHKQEYPEYYEKEYEGQLCKIEMFDRIIADVEKQSGKTVSGIRIQEI